MKRWKITIEYNGGNYAGFQVQDNVLTVQEAIETALKKFCQKDIRITVAGRTDAGVHATGQVAHFDLDYKTSDGDVRPITGFELAKAINAHLISHPITVVDAQEVDADFHARFHALSKTYRYRILNRAYPPALDKGFVWWVKKPLDVALVY